MDLKISQELAQAIANYLQNKPFVEVHKLLDEMSRMEKVKEEKDA